LRRLLSQLQRAREHLQPKGDRGRQPHRPAPRTPPPSEPPEDEPAGDPS
jgi:hypothetical protein